MGINTLIIVLKENLSNVINNSQLPIGIVYYVLKDLLIEVEGVYEKSLQKEAQERLAEIKRIEKEKEDIKEHQE